MKALTIAPLRYHLRIYRREHLALPAGLWTLFVLVVALMRMDGERTYDMANAFLGFILPLLAGILAASAIVDDTALELQLAAPRAPWRTLVERLALLLGIIAVAAFAYQAYLAVMGVDLAPLGNLAARQLTWLLPSLALMGLASLFALAAVQGTAGALLVGLVWLMQLLLRDWFLASPWARYLFLFMRARYSTNPALVANELCLLGVAVALTAAAGWLLKREERYL
ncbi:MAG TPA: hypothetical protein PLJ35_03265 [Anaerolineae bacterium]|nr:hypothetical protein [Anaerolineae bacterium]HOQ97822.1 hypothetical protein [Anaerolineae bacterium]HPL28946.1 hypothetical protein [Anaerolineae bacterium]